MKTQNGRRRLYLGVAVGLVLILGCAGFSYFSADAQASPWHPLFRHNKCETCDEGHGVGEMGGSWHWMRSPDEEKRIIIGLYNRYCIRCHGVDGRGIWDIPDVPDFTNTRWQASRSDSQIARATLEGRGACMPPFRGTLTLEEAWGMARYLRTFVPGTEASRPDRAAPVPDQINEKDMKK